MAPVFNYFTSFRGTNPGSLTNLYYLVTNIASGPRLVQLSFHSYRVDFFNQKTSIDLLWFIPWLELYTMWTIIMYICCQFKSQNPTPYFTTNYLVFILFFQEDYIYLNSIIHIVLIPILHKMCVFILMHKIIN